MLPRVINTRIYWPIDTVNLTFDTRAMSRKSSECIHVSTNLSVHKVYVFAYYIIESFLHCVFPISESCLIYGWTCGLTSFCPSLYPFWLNLQNRHRRIRRRTFAGFIYCYNAIFEFFALGLVNQSCFCLDCRCDILPRTIGTIPTLNLIRDNPSAVNRLFPIEKYPAIALLGRFKLSRLGGGGKRGRVWLPNQPIRFHLPSFSNHRRISKSSRSRRASLSPANTSVKLSRTSSSRLGPSIPQPTRASRARNSTFLAWPSFSEPIL